jgi:hypothetical protein
MVTEMGYCDPDEAIPRKSPLLATHKFTVGRPEPLEPWTQSQNHYGFSNSKEKERKKLAARRGLVFKVGV